MRLLLLLPLVYVTAVLQTSLGDALRVGRVAPDLLGLLAVVWLLVTPGRRAFLVAGLIGLVADLISPGQLGLATGSQRPPSKIRQAHGPSGNAPARAR